MAILTQVLGKSGFFMGIGRGDGLLPRHLRLGAIPHVQIVIPQVCDNGQHRFEGVGFAKAVVAVMFLESSIPG